MKIIAISGWRGSGKDTAAEILIDKFNYQRFAFADILKRMAAEEYNFPVEYAHDRKLKEAPLKHMPVNPKDDFTMGLYQLLEGEFPRDGNGNPYWSPRALCILKGSVNRLVDPDYWVKRTIYEIKTSVGYEPKAVITDMRYRNEMETLRREFGDNLLTVRVNRFEESDSEDASERDLDNAQFDVYLENTGTLEEFNAMVERIGRINE